MGDKDISGKNTLKNMIWRFSERVGAQLVSFFVSIVIARILDPEDFGVVAIISVFVQILYVFVDGGLANALVQKKNSDEIDFSTVFYTNLFLCSALYILLFTFAPIIADFYEFYDMTTLIRVSGLTLLISGIKNVQQAYISKHLLFRKFFWATLSGTIGSAIIGIWMALMGFGVWALVISGLFNSTVDMLILWITVRWRPQKAFSFERLKGLFAYGSKILLANIMQAIYSNIYELIIGKKYSPEDLAFYSRGRSIPILVVKNVDDAINTVMLPVMSECQDDVAVVKNMTKRALKMNMYIMTPALFGLGVIADSLVRVVLTEKWSPCVIYLQIFCFILAFRPVSTANLSAMKALGRSDLFFKLEIPKEIVGIFFLLLTINYGVMAIAIGVLASSFIGLTINVIPSKKLFNYGLGEQMFDIMPVLGISTIMALIVLSVGLLSINTVILLCIQVITGFLVYIALSIVFNLDEFHYMIALLKQFFPQKEKQ